MRSSNHICKQLHLLFGLRILELVPTSSVGSCGTKVSVCVSEICSDTMQFPLTSRFFGIACWEATWLRECAGISGDANHRWKTFADTTQEKLSLQYSGSNAHVYP